MIRTLRGGRSGRRGWPISRMNFHRAILAVSLFTAATAMSLSGCGVEKPEVVNTPAESDTTAFRNVFSLPDTTARIAALDAFLQSYPRSTFRAAAANQYYNLVAKRSPEQANAFSRAALAKEQDAATRGRLFYLNFEYDREHHPDRVPALLEGMLKDPSLQTDAYNSVAWNLVEEKQHLDQAIALAALGVQRAPNDEIKASVLDTEGWGYFHRGDYAQAVDRIEQAAKLDQSSEIVHHLAQAYDRAGRAPEARETYVRLLTEMEDPSIRERVRVLTGDLGGSVEEVFAQIDEIREAKAKPASDFTLKDYDGRSVSLASFAGKVVLLNFWHPT